MPTSQDHRDLFRPSNTLDELNLFRSLVDARDLTPDLTLALINIVRSDLEKPQRPSSAAYRRYSEVITCLDKQMPELYGQVVAAWQQRRPVVIARPMESSQQETSGEKHPSVDANKKYDSPQN
jgi:hypothetical protein